MAYESLFKFPHDGIYFQYPQQQIQPASIPLVENPTPIRNLQNAVSQNPPNQNFQQNFSLGNYNNSVIPKAGSISQDFLNKTYTLPVPNPQDMKLVNAATDSKILYNQSQQHINGLENSLKNSNLTDDQRTKIQNSIEDERKYQAHLADNMEMLRNANPNFDFNAYGFGRDNTVQEAVQARENLLSRVQNSLYDANDDAWQKVQQVYDDARARGIPASVADGMAQREKDRLGREIRAHRNDMFANYGVNSDGTINQFGTQLLGSMARNDPDAAKLYTQILTTPQQVYQTDNATMNNLLNLSAAGERQAQQLYYNMLSDAYKNALTFR